MVYYDPAPAPAPASVVYATTWGQPRPNLVYIQGTDIRYMHGVHDDIFFHGGLWYRWYGGHWYRCRRYGGAWMRIGVRPTFVVRIPRAHVKYRVVRPGPHWVWGRPSPRLVVIGGTGIKYVIDAGEDIFFYGGIWYRFHGGRWHHCRRYGGSWTVISAPPTVFSKIPRGHAKHHVVRHVRPKPGPHPKPKPGPEPKPKPGPKPKPDPRPRPRPIPPKPEPKPKPKPDPRPRPRPEPPKPEPKPKPHPRPRPEPPKPEPRPEPPKPEPKPKPKPKPEPKPKPKPGPKDKDKNKDKDEKERGGRGWQGLFPKGGKAGGRQSERGARGSNQDWRSKLRSPARPRAIHRRL
jgi:hypothetical protein